MVLKINVSLSAVVYHDDHPVSDDWCTTNRGEQHDTVRLVSGILTLYQHMHVLIKVLLHDCQFQSKDNS